MAIPIKIKKTPKILFIKGVFKKDCVSDDIFEKKILEAATDDIITSIIPLQNFVLYEKLPSIFTNIESWEKTSNLHCWHCNLGFSSIPVFIPGVIEPSNLKHKLKNNRDFSISVIGVFCYFECAMQYIKCRSYSIVDKTEMINKLKLLHKLFYNKPLEDMKDYPDPYQMKQFGGDLTVEEYKAKKEKYRNVI